MIDDDKCIVCDEKRFNEFKVPNWVSIYTIKNYLHPHESISFTVCHKCRKLSLEKILKKLVEKNGK